MKQLTRKQAKAQRQSQQAKQADGHVEGRSYGWKRMQRITGVRVDHVNDVVLFDSKPLYPEVA